MSNMVGVDTNILIYSQLEDSPYCLKAKECIELIHSQEIEAVISSQNIAEFCSAMTNSKYIGQSLPTDSVLEAAEEFLNSGYFKVIQPSLESTNKFVKLLKKLKVRGRDVHDVFLSSTFITGEIDQIITEDDKIFKKCGLKTIDLNHLQDLLG